MTTHEAQDASTPPSPAPPRAITAVAKDQLVACDNGEVCAAVGAVATLTRDDGSPSQAGDVLSVQPDGTLQTRPKGTTGLYERAIVASVGLIYRPKGSDGGAYIVPLVNDWPNK
jgi:hypothetical protein